MSNGVLIKNAAGDVLIDGAYSNLHRLYYGDISVYLAELGRFGETTYHAMGLVVFPAPVQTISPPQIVFQAKPGPPVGMAGYVGQPGNWTGFYVQSFASGDPWSPMSGYTLNFYYEAYVEPAYIIGQNNEAYGLLVNNASNEAVFDTRKHPMLIRGTLSFKGFSQADNHNRWSVAQVNAYYRWVVPPMIVASDEMVDGSFLGYFLRARSVSWDQVFYDSLFLQRLPDGRQEVTIYNRFYSYPYDDDSTALSPPIDRNIFRAGTHTSINNYGLAVRRY